MFVFRGTQPTIVRYKAEQLRLAVFQVLHEPERFDTLYVIDGMLTSQAPESPTEYEQVFVGYEGNARVGFAITAAEPGFQDVIRLIFGYDPERRAVLGMKVLESKETPGLGDKIEKDSLFVVQFDGAVTPLFGIKSRDATGDAHEIDMITGATISSRTVIRAINDAMERLGPMIDDYLRTDSQ